MKTNNKSTSKKPFVYAAILAVVITCLVLAFVHRSSVKNFFTADENKETKTIASMDNTKAVNEVDYGPSSPTDNEQINEQKKNADGTTTPVSNDLTATITNTRIVNGLAQVSVLVQGTTNGMCKLSLSYADKKLEKTAAVLVRAGVSTCDDFNIPVTELSNGTWDASVYIETTTAKSNPSTGTLQVGT